MCFGYCKHISLRYDSLGIQIKKSFKIPFRKHVPRTPICLMSSQEHKGLNHATQSIIPPLLKRQCLCICALHQFWGDQACIMEVQKSPRPRLNPNLGLGLHSIFRQQNEVTCSSSLAIHLSSEVLFKPHIVRSKMQTLLAKEAS